MGHRRRLPRIEPRGRAAVALDRPAGRSGYTLIEVVIAILLTAVIVTSVFSVSLSTKTGDVKTERKLKGAVGTRQVSAMLRNYVTGDLGVAMGPGDGGSWSMTIPSKGIQDHFGPYPCAGVRNDYALAVGDHCLTGILGPFEAPPYNARVWYTVVDTADAGLTANCPGCMLPAVTITASWDDP